MNNPIQRIQKLSPQQEVILDHLKCQGSITPNEGLLVHRIQCVSKRISELRQLGYNITDEWRKDATNKKYKRYFWDGSEPLTDEELMEC